MGTSNLFYLMLFNLIFLKCFITNVDSSKILVVFHMPFYSHYNLGSTLAFELAKRGHEVTFVNPFPKNYTTPNVREISTESVHKAISVLKKELYGLTTQSPIGLINFLTRMATIITEETLKDQNMQDLIRSGEQFDLIVIMQYINDAFLALGQVFGAPIVEVACMPPFPWDNFRLGYPTLSSYSPVLFSHFTNQMNLWERIQNTFYDLYGIGYYEFMTRPKHRELVKTYFPGSLDLNKFLNNVSLVLINSHASIYDATFRLPNTIDIGGFHVRAPKELPSDLKQFMDQSKEGVILFSLGSNLKVSDLAENKVQAFLKAFANLKQNVLWKWENDQVPKGASNNIKFIKWVPQNDILGHPNTKVFISHGGLLSTTESVYHGVPIIGMPVFSDQRMNMAHAVAYGYAILMPLTEISEEKLSNALNEVLYNPRFVDNVKRRSRIMRDQPLKPLDSAIYWMEYVIRHKGAPHLRYAGLELAWYQRYLLDVSVLFLTVFIIVVLGLHFVLELVYGIPKKLKVH